MTGRQGRPDVTGESERSVIRADDDRRSARRELFNRERGRTGVGFVPEMKLP